jgi:ribonuclease Y
VNHHSVLFLSLTMDQGWQDYLTVGILLLLACAAGAGLLWGGLYLFRQELAKDAQRRSGEMVKDAQRRSEELIGKAEQEAKTLRKQIELDVRNELASKREAFEADAAAQRKEIDEEKRRLAKREDNLDRKLDALTTKEKYLDDKENKVEKREGYVEAREKELADLIEQQKQATQQAADEARQHLLRVTGLSEEDARRECLKMMEREVEQEAAKMIQRRTQQAEEEAKEQALKITLNAIQRYASDHTADNTVTAIQIASDDMKGRVIGREGRNIRAFEKATGVDVIVDDTPGVVVVSCFDPIRRAVASEALEKLLEDGRIHPSRIEQEVEKIENEVQQKIVKFGKDAAIEVNLQGLHPKVNEMMGRLNYRKSYGQNILKHSIEVAFLCQAIADELGLDGEIARRCGYLHDIGKAMDHEKEGSHPFLGMEFLKKHKESEEVLNACGGHHNDIPATTPYTPIVMAADAISGARPGARRETLERYIKRLTQLEDIATSMEGVNSAYAIQAGREVRVIVDPDHVDDGRCTVIARDIAKRVSEEMTFPGEIRITVMREMRTVEYAR